MKISVIGATGNVGVHLVAELLARGHEVTAVSRHPEKMSDKPGLMSVFGDIGEPDKLAQVLRGHDIVISSVKFASFDFGLLMTALQSSGVSRYMSVGGAGSLLDQSGRYVYEGPTFPEVAKYNSSRGAEWLDILKKSDLDWTMLCPGLKFFDGERTGKFRLGSDVLIVDGNGASGISFQDYAIALADEVETGAHSKQRFAIGY